MDAAPEGPLYGTFARRVPALVLDSLVLVAVLLVVVYSVATLQLGQPMRLENRGLEVVWTAWLAATIAAVTFGWQGRLPGARRRP